MRTVPEALEYPSPAWNYVFRSPRSCVVTVTAFALHARSGARHHLATSVAARTNLQESAQPFFYNLGLKLSVLRVCDARVSWSMRDDLREVCQLYVSALRGGSTLGASDARHATFRVDVTSENEPRGRYDEHHSSPHLGELNSEQQR